MKSNPVVKVEWIDAESDSRWLDTDDIKAMKAPVAVSYGVVVRRDKDVLIIAHSICGDHFGVNTIPAGMVRKVTKL
jgi:hypothetical protein